MSEVTRIDAGLTPANVSYPMVGPIVAGNMSMARHRIFEVHPRIFSNAQASDHSMWRSNSLTHM